MDYPIEHAKQEMRQHWYIVNLPLNKLLAVSAEELAWNPILCKQKTELQTSLTDIFTLTRAIDRKLLDRLVGPERKARALRSAQVPTRPSPSVLAARALSLLCVVLNFLFSQLDVSLQSCGYIGQDGMSSADWFGVSIASWKEILSLGSRRFSE